MICTLVAVYAMMTWPTTLWTVCRYDCKRGLAVPYGQVCPIEWTFK